MRALRTLVAVQAIVLVVLFTVWSQRAAAAAPPPSGASVAGASRANEAGAANSASVDPVIAPAAGSIERTAAAVTGGGERDVTVILQGRLLGDPPPTSDSVQLGLRRDSEYRSAEIAATGAYAIAGLRPGTWRVRGDAPGHRLVEFEHTLGREPIQRLDITFEPATVLTVFARTPDDKRLSAELAKLGVWQGLHVIATAQPLAGDFAPTENMSVGDVGIGRHRQPSDPNRRAEQAADDGTLELDRPPPVNAALLLRHMVLQQQRIEPGQRELRFVVDVADVAARFAKVRMRVLGPAGPLAGANVQLSSAQGGGSHARTDEQGVVAASNVLPGLTSFEISAKDVEQFHSHVTIAPGADLDLGDIALSARAELKGRTVDATGAPLAAFVQWTALDLWRPPHPLIDRRSASSDGDGNFELWGTGRRRYTVYARAEDGRVGFAQVDGAAAGGEPLTIVLRATHALRLDARATADVRCAVIRDPSGVPLRVSRIEPRWREVSIALPDGDYVLVVHDGAGTQLSRKPFRMAGADLTEVLQ